VTDAPVREFDARAFRDALGCFATGVTLVTTVDRQGRAIAVTVNSFSSVSLEPPLVLFSLARTAGNFEDFVSAEHFAINVLAQEQQPLSSNYARSGEALLQPDAHVLGRHGGPLIGGALAHFECRRHAVYDGGDHVILLGEVKSIALRDGGRPLLYFRGRYGEIAEADSKSAR
jgi:flavin reductase (DIM6/NTAB) family NADH-FMN oxidoreductase RutF